MVVGAEGFIAVRAVGAICQAHRPAALLAYLAVVGADEVTAVIAFVEVRGAEQVVAFCADCGMGHAVRV